MILDNSISRGRDLITADTLAGIDPAEIQVVDARVAKQYAADTSTTRQYAHASLREQLATLDKDKPVVTYCNKGTTGNAPRTS
jgi:rhodanese-related sulfurtransferase